ncbi:glutathione S-transferase [Aspergillus varians]
MSQPITIYMHGKSPNPWKVILILEELKLAYTTQEIEFTDVKSKPFTNINPNGRLPAIEDPNTGITLWESGAILEYLVETYDKDHKISFEHGSTDYFLAKQYLHFQMSGQGPYFGQAVWFLIFHPEKIVSAQERYINETKRVTGVLEGILEGKEFLVGGRFSYADAAFQPWYTVVEVLFTDSIDLSKDFPNVRAWLDRIQARPGVAKALEFRAEVLAAEKAAEEKAAQAKA